MMIIIIIYVIIKRDVSNIQHCHVTVTLTSLHISSQLTNASHPRPPTPAPQIRQSTRPYARYKLFVLYCIVLYCQNSWQYCMLLTSRFIIRSVYNVCIVSSGTCTRPIYKHIGYDLRLSKLGQQQSPGAPGQWFSGERARHCSWRSQVRIPLMPLFLQFLIVFFIFSRSTTFITIY